MSLLVLLAFLGSMYWLGTQLDIDKNSIYFSMASFAVATMIGV